MNQPESPWHADVGEPPIKPQLREELAELERQAAAKREEVKAKLAAVQARENDWRAILNTGMEAWTRLQNAMSHLKILRDRRDVEAAKFDALVGGENYTEGWHAAVSISPLLDNSIFSATKEENPFVHHARNIAALDLGIARIESRLPEFERAEADARKAAQDYAKANGLEHAVAGEAQPMPADTDDSDAAIAIANEPPEQPEKFPGRRKGTR